MTQILYSFYIYLTIFDESKLGARENPDCSRVLQMRRGTIFVNEGVQVDTEAILTTQDKIFLANVEEVGQPDYVFVQNLKYLFQ